MGYTQIVPAVASGPPRAAQMRRQPALWENGLTGEHGSRAQGLRPRFSGPRGPYRRVGAV
jgi:hypothetical protein